MPLTSDVLEKAYLQQYKGVINIKSDKLLQGLYSLDHNIKVYIPSTKDVDAATDNSKYVTEALTLFGDLFGGATEHDAMGSWVSQTKGLVIEQVKIVESYASREQVENGLSKVIEFANKVKREMSQEAVSLEYDNKLYFV